MPPPPSLCLSTSIPNFRGAFISGREKEKEKEIERERERERASSTITISFYNNYYFEKKGVSNERKGVLPPPGSATTTIPLPTHKHFDSIKRMRLPPPPSFYLSTSILSLILRER